MMTGCAHQRMYNRFLQSRRFFWENLSFAWSCMPKPSASIRKKNSSAYIRSLSSITFSRLLNSTDNLGLVSQRQTLQRVYPSSMLSLGLYNQRYFSTRDLDRQVASLEDVKQIVAEGGAHLIDVRERTEFESGHIPGALNIPLGEILASEDLSELESESFAFPPQSEDIIVYCKAGVRSHVAQSFLQEKGWKNCRNFVGSWLQWEEYQQNS